MKNYNQFPGYINTAKKYRSLVMRIAYTILSRDCVTFGEAQSKAWKVVELLTELYSNASNVEFKFKKSNGQTRIAKGTRNLKLVPSNQQPTTQKPIETLIKAIPYFDADKNAWRSFSTHTLIAS